MVLTGVSAIDVRGMDARWCDVSDVRSAVRDLRAVIDVMNRVESGESIGSSAAALCDAVTVLDGIHGAVLLIHDGDGTMHQIGAGGVCAGPRVSEVVLPAASAQLIVAATLAGPWCMDLAATAEADVGRDLHACLNAEGLTAAAIAGVRWHETLLGVLVVATDEADGATELASRLDAVEQLGSFASSVLGRQAHELALQQADRLLVLDVMTNRRFHPVFQPVIEMKSGRIAGYEALTRFDDGCAPDTRVAQAHAVGLGPAFEACLAAAAVQAARRLPSDVWLGLNFSAQAILEGFATPVVSKANRAIVIEITEHAAIDCYPDVRHAITQGGDILLSVDDAGAGFASLLHVLELDPDIVKLDIGLIRGIDRDPARQALAAGMCHFAHKTGTTLIAEGVETQAEAATVRELGVELAQGYLFGRPALLDEGLFVTLTPETFLG